MIFAEGEDGSRAEAVPKGRAVCPICKAPVIAKCGAIKVHHWAHEAGDDCDRWSEPMTQWHLDWQRCWPGLQREVVIGAHRADVLTVLGGSMPWLVRRDAWHYLGTGGVGLEPGARLVVEIQHSYLPAGEIAERERYYSRNARQMAWVWDCRKPHGDGRLYLHDSQGDRKLFTWKHARLTQRSCSYPVFLDLGTGDLLLVTKWPEIEYEYEDYYIPDGGGEMAVGVRRRRGQGLCYLVGRQEFVQALQLPGDVADCLARAGLSPGTGGISGG
jgi:hypothetical protein